MGRKSTIARLPEEVKSYITAMLATGAQTLDELISDLQERFPGAASAKTLPSRSALGRYGQNLERRLSAIRASTEAAKMISAQAGDNTDARSEALTALVQTELFEAILMMQEAGESVVGEDGEEVKMDIGDRIGMLSNAAKNIATLTRSSVNLKKFQSEVEESTRKKLLAEQAAALKAMPIKGGVTDETKTAIRAALGIL